MKKIGSFSGYNVYYVSGYVIRREIDKTFPNYGSHRSFKFIPKNEFWIDYENRNKREAKYIIINFLAFEKEIEKGKNVDDAIKIANMIEKRERHKSKWIKKLRKIKIKEKLLKKIHEKRLFGKITDKLKIWLIDGDIVRSLFDVDFNQGGHGYVYPFIPKN